MGVGTQAAFREEGIYALPVPVTPGEGGVLEIIITVGSATGGITHIQLLTNW